MSKVTESGERLFAAFRQAVPPAEDFGGRKKPQEKEIRRRVDDGLGRFYDAARAERARMGFGLVGRARVAFDLQRRLFAAGYPPPLVKQVVFAMLVAAFVGR